MAFWIGIFAASYLAIGVVACVRMIAFARSLATEYPEASKGMSPMAKTTVTLLWPLLAFLIGGANVYGFVRCLWRGPH